MVTTLLSTFYPENVLGLHVNMAGALTTGGMVKGYVAQIPGLKYLMADKSDFEKVDGLFPRLGYLLQESGYMHIQGTKPDTVGVGLSNSPLGLAAYILEKFSTWTNKSWRELHDGGPAMLSCFKGVPLFFEACFKGKDRGLQHATKQDTISLLVSSKTTPC